MATKPNKTSSNKRKQKIISKKMNTSFKKNILIFISVLLVIFLVVFGYFLGQKRELSPIKKENVLEELVKVEIKKPIVKHSDDKNKTKDVGTKPSKLKNDKKPILPKELEKKDEEKKNTYTSSKSRAVILAERGRKPKMVIVIDDVHTKKQLEMIEKLNMKITPSIFPPYTLSPKSHLLAKDLKHYMIHLPMESSNKKFNTQSKTIMSSFSDERIVDRVIEIRKLFPEGKYVNNHTGSIFTANYEAMKKLYIALKLEGFIFVDSFTHRFSKVKKIADEHGDAYVRRTSFIDNVHTIYSIQKQLKLAVKKAKKNGYVIAIGHPHKVTMQALKKSKSILKDVELVYIDALYKRN
jgi:polysaccharide deacetylase 2 family uncharacterized protein YibQ